MTKIIQFPIEKITINKLLNSHESELEKLPPYLADCYKNTVIESYNISKIMEGKSFDVQLPAKLNGNEILKIKSEIQNIIKEYEKEIMNLLKNLIKTKLDLCNLQYQVAEKDVT